jgi:hypothetical protein
MLSVQLASSSDQSKKDMIATAIKSKLSLANTTLCENKLKSHYNITPNVEILMRKVDFNSILNLKDLNNSYVSDSSKFNYYHPLTSELLDINVCNETQAELKFPMNYRANLNMTKYRRLASQNVDSFNPAAPAFVSRCVRLRDNITGYDTTINFRRQNYYQNKSVDCGEGCQYQEIDNLDYVVCNCSSLKDEEYNNSFVSFVLDSLPKMNWDIISCYQEVFIAVSFINIGNLDE